MKQRTPEEILLVNATPLKVKLTAFPRFQHYVWDKPEGEARTAYAEVGAEFRIFKEEQLNQWRYERWLTFTDEATMLQFILTWK